jgi:DNA-binding response OmpR family regulator
MRILIIDDNQEITENISLYLRSKGFDTDIAPNGSQAFDMIQRKEFDFLIVDRMMPEIDGLALIRMLQSRHIHIPFLFLTALGKQIDRIEWLSLGADDYLVKPFDLQELFFGYKILLVENEPNQFFQKIHLSFLEYELIKPHVSSLEMKWL